METKNIIIIAVVVLIACLAIAGIGSLLHNSSDINDNLANNTTNKTNITNNTIKQNSTVPVEQEQSTYYEEESTPTDLHAGMRAESSEDTPYKNAVYSQIEDDGRRHYYNQGQEIGTNNPDTPVGQMK